MGTTFLSRQRRRCREQKRPTAPGHCCTKPAQRAPQRTGPRLGETHVFARIGDARNRKCPKTKPSADRARVVHPCAPVFPRDDDEQCLKERETCALIGVSRQTLRRWRDGGSGPPYFRIGRLLRYRLGDLRQWLAANTHADTTAEAVGK